MSTPKGVGNPFHDLYMHGVNGIEGWRSFRFPTSANKLIDNGEIEDLGGRYLLIYLLRSFWRRLWRTIRICGYIRLI